ncbi:MAG TPA: sulfite exporter TauE/SafE family protein, partial [Pseudomonas sp.]
MNTFFALYQHIGWSLSALVLVAFLLAGTVKGMIGMGLPTVAMGMLGLAMLPTQAAALLIIPS